MTNLWKLFKGKVKNFRHTPDIGKFFLRNLAHKVTFIDENCQGHHPMSSWLEWCPAGRSLPPRLSSHRHALHGPASPCNSASANPRQVLHADVKAISSRMRPLTGRGIKTCYKIIVFDMFQYAVLHCHRRGLLNDSFQNTLHYYEEMHIKMTDRHTFWRLSFRTEFANIGQASKAGTGS